MKSQKVWSAEEGTVDGQLIADCLWLVDLAERDKEGHGASTDHSPVFPRFLKPSGTVCSVSGH